MEQVASKMVLAQVSDVVFLAIMPFCLKRLGIKGIILTGLSAWVLRYSLFAAGAGHQVHWPYYIGILLHGMCYDFFFLAGQIYVDQRAPREVRANAQGFIALVTLGVGMTIGNILNGYVTNWVTSSDKVIDWRTLWLVPAAIAATVGVVFLALFHEKAEVPAIDAETVAEAEEALATTP
jgi:MFS family permease